MLWYDAQIYFLALVISLAVLFSGLMPAVAFVIYSRNRDALYRRRSPVPRQMLRRPGHSLQMKIDERNEQIQDSVQTLAWMPVLVVSTSVVYWLLRGEATSVLIHVVHVLAVIMILFIFSRRLWNDIRQRDILTRGLDGEIYTGQELDQLMKFGCHVFHDIPTDSVGNIDHIVVSRSGVFTIETKTLGKPEECADPKVVVNYDLGVLAFPDRQVPIPLKQATDQAQWLSRYLTKRLKTGIAVEPIISLPGWYVKRAGHGICVINPTEVPAGFFVKASTKLGERQVQHIVEDLDRLCRDVNPSTHQGQDSN